MKTAFSQLRVRWRKTDSIRPFSNLWERNSYENFAFYLEDSGSFQSGILMTARGGETDEKKRKNKLESDAKRKEVEEPVREK